MKWKRLPSDLITSTKRTLHVHVQSAGFFQFFQFSTKSEKKYNFVMLEPVQIYSDPTRNLCSLNRGTVGESSGGGILAHGASGSENEEVYKFSFQ